MNSLDPSLSQGVLYNLKKFKVKEGFTDNIALIDKITTTSTELNKIQSNIVGAITNYGNSINKTENPYLGQNIQFGSNGPLAYITKRANLKWYNNNESYYQTNGHNGCPTNIIQITDPKFPAPLDLSPGQLTKSDPILTIGSPMTTGQSCGREGTNVKVTSYINNPTSTLIGCYNATVPVPVPIESVTNESVVTNVPIITPTNMDEMLGIVNSDIVNSCKKLAAEKGYQFFGITNYSWPNRYTCWGSNNITKAISYGESDTCIVNSDTEYIGDLPNNSMALYYINETMYPENIGKIGYIDDDSNISEYPASMIYYTYIPSVGRSMDARPITDWMSNKTLEEVQKMCSDMNNSTQIIYTKHPTLGELYLIATGSSTNLINNISYTTYSKQTNITSDASCNKKIHFIDSSRWQSYINSGQQMTPTTKCGISNIIYGNPVIEGFKKAKKITVSKPKIIPKSISKDISKGISKGISEIKQNVTTANIDKGISQGFNEFKKLLQTVPQSIIKKALKHLPASIVKAYNKKIAPKKKNKVQHTNQIKQDANNQVLLQAQLLQNSQLLDQDTNALLTKHEIKMNQANQQFENIPPTINKYTDNMDTVNTYDGTTGTGSSSATGSSIIKEGYTNISSASMQNILNDSYISVNYGIYTYILWNIIATLIIIGTIEFTSNTKMITLRGIAFWTIVIISVNLLLQYYGFAANILIILLYIVFKKINSA
jgi:hypothetical protein